MRVEDVVDQKSLLDYVEQLSEPDRRLVFSRITFLASAKMLPITIASYFDHGWAVAGDFTQPIVFASVAVSRVSILKPSIEIVRTANILANLLDKRSNEAPSPFRSAILTAVYAVANASWSMHSKEEKTSIWANTRAAMSDFELAGKTLGIDVWPIVRDCLFDQKRRNYGALRLADPDGNLRDLWESMRLELRAFDGLDWSFWIAWYDRILANRDTHMDMMVSILNKITKEDWQKGPAHINPMFDEVLALYRAEDQKQDTSALTLTKGEPVQVEKTKTAMIEHRRELPQTFDATLGLITLEIERLQGLNYKDDEHRDEAVRQIGILSTLHKTVSELLKLVPKADEMASADAEKAEGLVRLYVNKFKEWPRANADEMVDNTYRFGIIGLLAVAAPMVGISATAAAVGGATFFGGKKLLDNAKAAKSLLDGA